jgi:hypothetical protein
LELMAEYYGSNNGRIVMSVRMLGTRLNCSQSTASRAIRDLITYGFVECSKASSFFEKRLAAEYRMTHIKCDATGKLPSNSFIRTEPNGKAQGLAATNNGQASVHSFTWETNRFISGPS